MSNENTTTAAVTTNKNTSQSSDVRDVCGYCGADNGPIGEEGRGISRVGWDCYMCGGN